MTYARPPGDAGPEQGRHRDWPAQDSPVRPGQAVYGERTDWPPEHPQPSAPSGPEPPPWQEPARQRSTQRPVPPTSPQRPKPATGHSPVAERDQPLADDYFRLTHDDQYGDLRLHPVITGIGLASALLGELIWYRKVTLRDGHLMCVDATPPRTALSHRILEQVEHEPRPRPVADWLNYLALDAHEQVAQRLLDANHVYRVKRRKGLRQHIVYQPVNSNSWHWVSASIASSLNRRRQMPAIEIHLAGLAKATNLLPAVMAHWEGTEFLGQLLPALPADVLDLLDTTAAVVEARVLSGH